MNESLQSPQEDVPSGREVGQAVTNRNVLIRFRWGLHKSKKQETLTPASFRTDISLCIWGPLWNLCSSKPCFPFGGDGTFDFLTAAVASQVVAYLQRHQTVHEICGILSDGFYPSETSRVRKQVFPHWVNHNRLNTLLCASQEAGFQLDCNSSFAI